MLSLKIKDDRYGHAIALLLRTGGGFQTRHQRTLIVNSAQRRILEEAGCVAENGRRPKGKGRGEKAK
jgi:hypothetical protein